MSTRENWQSTDAVWLHYHLNRDWDADPAAPGVWQLQTRNRRGYDTVVEELTVERAMQIADLLGCREECIAVMKRDADEMAERSRQRLIDSRKSRARSEEQALAERRESERVRGVVARLEGGRDAS